MLTVRCEQCAVLMNWVRDEMSGDDSHHRLRRCPRCHATRYDEIPAVLAIKPVNVSFSTSADPASRKETRHDLLVQ